MYIQSNRNYVKVQMLFCTLLLTLLCSPIEAVHPWAIGLVMQADGPLSEPARLALKSLADGIAGKDTHPFIAVELREADYTTRYSIDADGIHTLFKERSLQPSASLYKFCEWFFATVKTEHTMLILSGHGSGILEPQWSAYSQRWIYEFDEGNSYYNSYKTEKNEHFAQMVFTGTHGYGADHSMHKSMFLANETSKPITSSYLAEILTRTLRGNKLAIIGFDACHMGMVEVAHDLRSCASLMVASQDCEEHGGWDYRALLDAIQLKSPVLVARHMAYSYEKSQRSKNHPVFSLAVWDLGLADDVTRSCERITRCMQSCLRIDGKVFHDLLCSVRQKNQRFCFMPMYADLMTFFNALYDELSGLQATDTVEELRTALLDGSEYLRRMMLASVAGPACPGAYGCSVYFPYNHRDTSYYANPWALMSGWGSFIDYFIKI